MLTGVPLSLIAVLLLMAALFESVTQPFAILIALPLPSPASRWRLRGEAMLASSRRDPELAEHDDTRAGVEGDLERATAQFQQAVKLDPENAQARYQLASALGRQGDHRAALEHLKSRRRLGLALTRLELQGQLILRGNKYPPCFEDPARASSGEQDSA